MLNLVLIILIGTGLAFITWKFMVANKREKIASLVLAGASAGLRPLLSFLQKDTTQKSLVPGWEFAARYFFQTLSATQYDDCCKRLGQTAPAPELLDAVNTQATAIIVQHAKPAAQQDAAALQTKLSTIAQAFTTGVAQVLGDKGDVEACTRPLVASTAERLGAILFTPEGFAEHRGAFTETMAQALEETAEEIYKLTSGKTEAGRYLGGGCC